MDGRGKNHQARKKTSEKRTYPPPADGLYVCFLCKSRCSATDAVAQAGRGASHAIGHFILCRVLQRNAARLHNGVLGGHGWGKAGVPDFIGREKKKRGN
jgi:hypothetical protein